MHDSKKLYSRDINYLRDVVTFWAFLIFSIVTVASIFHPSNHQYTLRIAALAVTALALAKEKMVVFFGTFGFVALQCLITLVTEPWNWIVFNIGILTLVPFLIAAYVLRNKKWSYHFPEDNEFGALDILLSVASICGAILLLYLIKPDN